MTRYGHMLKINVDKARVHVVMRNKVEGSVLQGTVKATCLGVEMQLELESDEPPERIATLVRMAENGCYTKQSLTEPVEVSTAITLNGQPLSEGVA